MSIVSGKGVREGSSVRMREYPDLDMSALRSITMFFGKTEEHLLNEKLQQCRTYDEWLDVVHQLDVYALI